VTKQVNANKRNHVNLTVPWKLEVLRRLGSGKLKCGYDFIQQRIVKCLIW